MKRSEELRETLRTLEVLRKKVSADLASARAELEHIVERANNVQADLIEALREESR